MRIHTLSALFMYDTPPDPHRDFWVKVMCDQFKCEWFITMERNAHEEDDVLKAILEHGESHRKDKVSV